MARRCAWSPSSVLLIGENGTGKELFAKGIHYCGRRAAGPFIAENCAAVPADLFEDRFFGNVPGAFTGARGRPGLFEQANAGTLFLDGINSLALPLQPKLLRVLQERQCCRLGDTVCRQFDVRIIAACNCDLEKAVAAEKFREDLFFRLAVLPVIIPPLRDRLEDIPLLANDYLRRLIAELQAANRGEAGEPDLARIPTGFSAAALSKLTGFSWPGNVRQLQNVIQRAIFVAAGRLIEAQDIVFSCHLERSAVKSSGSLLQQKKKVAYEFEQGKMLEILAEHHWNITESAEASGTDRRTFYGLVTKHALRQPPPSREP